MKVVKLLEYLKLADLDDDIIVGEIGNDKPLEVKEVFLTKGEVIIGFIWENKKPEKVIVPIEWEDFYVYAESKDIPLSEIDDFYEYYENLLPLEENLEHLKDQIKERYDN